MAAMYVPRRRYVTVTGHSQCRGIGVIFFLWARTRRRRCARCSDDGIDGAVTAEVARRQSDGTWRWVIDKFINA